MFDRCLITPLVMLDHAGAEAPKFPLIIFELNVAELYIVNKTYS